MRDYTLTALQLVSNIYCGTIIKVAQFVSRYLSEENQRFAEDYVESIREGQKLAFQVYEDLR